VSALGFPEPEKLWAGVFASDPDFFRLQKLLLMIVFEVELPSPLSTLKKSVGLFSGDCNAEIIEKCIFFTVPIAADFGER
jgi:hypothetical protein